LFFDTLKQIHGLPIPKLCLPHPSLPAAPVSEVAAAQRKKKIARLTLIHLICIVLLILQMIYGSCSLFRSSSKEVIQKTKNCFFKS
jgi:hypothetical protein